MDQQEYHVNLNLIFIHENAFYTVSLKDVGHFVSPLLSSEYVLL